MRSPSTLTLISERDSGGRERGGGRKGERKRERARTREGEREREREREREGERKSFTLSHNVNDVYFIT